MSLNKKIVLDNGQEFNFFKIGIIEVSQEKIKVMLNCFKTEKVFNSFNERFNLMNQQKLLLEQFIPLSEKEKLTKREKENLDKLQLEINDLANKINEIGSDTVLVSATIKEEIPYIEDFSIPNIEKELINTKTFKLAKIIE